MAKSTRLTPLGINKTKAKTKDIWLSDDEGTRGGGRLVVRIGNSGSKIFYFRYSFDGARQLLPIGPFSIEPVDGLFTLEQARQEARGYSAMHRVPQTRDVIAHLKGLEAAKLEAKRQEADQQRIQDLELQRASKYSFQALCDTYVKHLRALKKASADDVASLFKLYVKPSEWADKPAKSITAKQVTTLLRAIVEAGKGRTAGKLRSSMRAAYELAMKAELDPTTPSEFISFGIESNPVASTAALSKFSKARDRALSGKEMAEVWKRLKAIPDDGPLPSLAARMVILLGGQRAAQLLRVKTSEGVDLEDGIITLMDKKGRREEARMHAIPMVGAAASDVENLMKRASAMRSNWLFASHKSHLGANTLSHVILDISRDMTEKGLSLKPFQFSDIRRTAETMMASIGIGERIRAQLQSHGLSGVQQRHYDKYEYLPEKRNALSAWHAHLESLLSGEPMASNVTQLKTA